MAISLARALPITAFAVLVGGGQASAHDFWLERKAGTFLLRHGHHGGASLPLDAGKVRTFACRKDTGAPENLVAKAVVSPKQLSLSATCAVLSAYLDAGFFSL